MRVLLLLCLAIIMQLGAVAQGEMEISDQQMMYLSDLYEKGLTFDANDNKTITVVINDGDGNKLFQEKGESFVWKGEKNGGGKVSTGTIYVMTQTINKEGEISGKNYFIKLME